MANVMRSLLLWLALLAAPAIAQMPQFSKPTLVPLESLLAAKKASTSLPVKASLVFREGSKTYGYPHHLEVFLRIENTTNSDVYWYANSVEDIEAELLDSAGKPVPCPPSACSIMSNAWIYMIPHGSRFDWLISSGGISMWGSDLKKNYALMVGGQGWLIPFDSVHSYSLRIRLRGIPRVTSEKETKGMPKEILLEIPPTQLETTSKPLPLLQSQR